MLRTLYRALFGALALSFSLAAPASATVMVELSLDELIQRADVIVHGTVTASAVRVEMRDGSLEPQALTTIRVHEWIAGTGGETVQLRELGGSWEGGGVHYDGTPAYERGEEVVLFLERRPDAPHDLRTLAMVQGKFSVRHGVPGVPSCVLRDLSSISFVRWADGRQSVSEPSEEAAMELQTFLEFIRRARGPANGVVQ